MHNQMVVDRQPSAADLDQLFGALADATRRDILSRVMDADASVSELAERYDMSFAAVHSYRSSSPRMRRGTSHAF